MSFGRTKAKVTNIDQPLVTFDDVAGIEESKHELTEIVEFLKDPDKFLRLGARVPKGVLMIGPPGTGENVTGPRHRRRGWRAISAYLRLGVR